MNDHLPASYDVLVAQIAKTDELLTALRSHTAADSPKMRAFVQEVEATQLRMFTALAACKSDARILN
jgi:hypothetical protein